MAHRFPTLAFIERAGNDDTEAFTASPHAAHLERRARELAESFWSETVWFTGLVSEAAYLRVRDALHRERVALGDVVTVLSAPVPIVLSSAGDEIDVASAAGAA